MGGFGSCPIIERQKTYKIGFFRETIITAPKKKLAGERSGKACVQDGMFEIGLRDY
jgi:hypothetical protein